MEEVGANWSPRRRELIDPQLQVAELEKIAQLPPTRPDY